MTAVDIPIEVAELTAAWFSSVLDADVRSVEVRDQHSGTTGRARVALRGDGVPATVFVKLPPFDVAQRRFVDAVGMGVTEARFFRELAADVPVRVPSPLYAAHDGKSRYVMVLEDLEASGCRFPRPTDPDIAARAHDIVAQLAHLHAQYWESERFAPDGELAWLAGAGSGRGDGGARFVRMAVETYADRLPDGFTALAELYVDRVEDIQPLYRQGARTLVHGDPHLGNLFVDGDRTGFLDWAVIGHAPGMRDVAYVVCNSIPTDVRRAEERALVARYCDVLARQGVMLDRDEAWEQYRLFALTSWIAATCTVGMGSAWQPEHIGLESTARATLAAVDLDLIGLLRSRLP